MSIIALIPTKIKLYFTYLNTVEWLIWSYIGYFTLFLRVITLKDFKRRSRGGNKCGYEHNIQIGITLYEQYLNTRNYSHKGVQSHV